MRTMSIEAAVAWAVRDELPKVGMDVVGGWVRAGAPNGAASPALAAHAAGSLGASVDARTNRYGVVPDFGALERSSPHPLALAIGEAMLSLDAIQPGGFDSWEPFEDLDLLAADPVAGPLLAQAERDARAQAGTMARMTGSLSALMVKRAVLGPPGGWETREVTARVVTGGNGKPVWLRRVARPARWNARGEVTATEMVEVEGFNPKTRRPWPDAYRKLTLTPDPLTLALARAEWQLWRAALDVLFEDVALLAVADMAITSSSLPLRPWLEGAPARPRVISGGDSAAMPAKDAAPRAGRVITAMAAEDHKARYRREATELARRKRR